MNRYRQLTSGERYALSALRKQGCNQAAIARALGHRDDQPQGANPARESTWGAPLRTRRGGVSVVQVRIVEEADRCTEPGEVGQVCGERACIDDVAQGGA